MASAIQKKVISDIQKQCGAEEIYSSSEMVGLTAGMNVTNISKKTTDFHFSNI